MSVESRTYLALGDSMSIDYYTGVTGGGAVNQYFRSLGEGWTLDDRTYDGCCMQGVPIDGEGALITITIGGNDLLMNRDRYLEQGLDSVAAQHLELMQAIRGANPSSLLIAGDIYAPQKELSSAEGQVLDAANAAIRSNCARVDAHLAEIYRTFQGHEDEYLCLDIEPTLKGADAIAMLFREIFSGPGGGTSP